MIPTHDRVLWVTVKVWGNEPGTLAHSANISRAQSGDRPPAAMKHFMNGLPLEL